MAPTTDTRSMLNRIRKMELSFCRWLVLKYDIAMKLARGSLCILISSQEIMNAPGCGNLLKLKIMTSLVLPMVLGQLGSGLREKWNHWHKSPLSAMSALKCLIATITAIVNVVYVFVTIHTLGNPVNLSCPANTLHLKRQILLVRNNTNSILYTLFDISLHDLTPLLRPGRKHSMEAR